MVDLEKLQRLVEEKAKEYDPALKVKVTAVPGAAMAADYYDCEKDVVEVVVPPVPPDEKEVLSYLARGIGARKAAKEFGCEFYGTATIRFGSPIVRKDVRKAMNRAAVSSIYGMDAACHFDVEHEYLNLVHKDVGDFVTLHTEEEAEAAHTEFRAVAKPLMDALMICTEKKRRTWDRK